MKILLFGGTAEGHTLARRLAEAGHLVTCCVATDYGRDVLEPQPNLTVHMGRMSPDAMAGEMADGYDCVVDATHPYAAQVSENIRSAAQRAGLVYQRLLRPSQLTADGAVLLASNRGHDSIALFSVDAATGRLACRNVAKLTGRFPRDFAFLPGERFVVVGHKMSDEIQVYRFDRATCGLTPVGAAIPAWRPLCFKFGRR